MSALLIFFLILVIILVFFGIWYYFFRTTEALDSVLRYGNMVFIESDFTENGFLSFCNQTETACTKKLFVPTEGNETGVNSRRWKIMSTSTPDGNPIRYGDIVRIISATMDQPVGFCGSQVQSQTCDQNIGLLPTSTTSTSTTWILSSSDNPTGTPILPNSDLRFVSTVDGRALSVCGRGSESCGGVNSVNITTRKDTGIGDLWRIRQIPN